MDLSDLIEMLSTDVFSLKVCDIFEPVMFSDLLSLEPNAILAIQRPQSERNAILAIQRLQSEKETSRTTEWNFLRRESILIIVVCFLTWLGVNFR